MAELRVVEWRGGGVVRGMVEWRGRGWRGDERCGVVERGSGMAE